VTEWAADVEVDEQLAAGLIGDRFPQLRGAGVRPLGEGWDVTAWLVADAWVFRFPRREVVLPGFRHELEVLPRIAHRLPLPIPVPELIGAPGRGYPWRFAGARYLTGVELCDARLDSAARAALGRPLGSFLRALHTIDPAPFGQTLPADPLDRGYPAARADRTDARLIEIEARGLWRLPRQMAAVIEAANDLGCPEPVSVVHGDMHLRHLLVDGGRAAGVIDWIDVCRGDPGMDMVLYWSALDPPGRERFRAAYGEIGEQSLLRGRVLGLFLSATLAVYADAEGMRPLRTEALAALDRCCVD
jgi:aminoglycoside phosphotransferase (APT) family kinase protein